MILADSSQKWIDQVRKSFRAKTSILSGKPKGRLRAMYQVDRLRSNTRREAETVLEIVYFLH